MEYYIGQYVEVTIAGRVVFVGTLTNAMLSHLRRSYPANNMLCEIVENPERPLGVIVYTLWETRAVFHNALIGLYTSHEGLQRNYQKALQQGRTVFWSSEHLDRDI